MFTLLGRLAPRGAVVTSVLFLLTSCGVDLPPEGPGVTQMPTQKETASDEYDVVYQEESVQEESDPPGGKPWTPVWEGEWMPQGMWGAEGDPRANGITGIEQTSGDSVAYSSLFWSCLICNGGQEDEIEDEPQRIAREVELEDEAEADDGEPNVHFLSADDSNSESSPVLARARIEQGMLVPAEEIRVWEFLNYYNITYPAPKEGDLNVLEQLRPYNVDEGLYALQIGVQAEYLAETNRRPMSLTLVLDTSGSMSGDPIRILKEVCSVLASKLKRGDLVSMVLWNSTTTVPLDGWAVTGANDDKMLLSIGSIEASGSTDMNSGLVKGYRLAKQHFIEGGLNRVVLVSDGDVNTGVTSEEIISGAAASGESDAIYMVGVGTSNNLFSYRDDLMDMVTDWGKGAYVYLDSVEEATRIFDDRFLETMEVAALDVKVSLSLPHHFTIDKFFGEEISKKEEEVASQHLAANDAMVYQQMIKTTRPLQIDPNDTIGVEVKYRDVRTGETVTKNTVATIADLLKAPCLQLRKGDTIVVYAQTLGRTYQMYTQGMEKEANIQCQWGLDIVKRSAEVLEDADLREIAALLERYCGTLRQRFDEEQNGDWY